MQRQIFVVQTIVAVVVGLGAFVSRGHPMNPTIPADFGSAPSTVRQGTYLIPNDDSIEACDFASVDRGAVGEIPHVTSVNNVGPVEGEALNPIPYQDKIAYVMGTWLVSAASQSVIQSLIVDNVQASTVCNDGWVSHSHDHREPYSYHRGVKAWLQ